MPVPRAVRRSWSAAALVVGGLLLGAAVVWGAQSTPMPTDAGQLPPATAPSSGRTPGASVVVSTGPMALPAPSRPGAPPSPPTRSTMGVPERTPPPSAGSPPVSLQLPSLGVTAGVEPVRAVDGVLQVPDDPAVVGWWTGGAAPGASEGSVVIDGHIDSAALGEGAMFRLGELGPGDAVRTLGADGREQRWTVVARRVYAKSSGLPAEVFRRTGPVQLVLISCGGPFDERTRSYEDNIVVYATPAG